MLPVSASISALSLEIFNKSNFELVLERLISSLLVRKSSFDVDRDLVMSSSLDDIDEFEPLKKVEEKKKKLIRKKLEENNFLVFFSKYYLKILLSTMC